MRAKGKQKKTTGVRIKHRILVVFCTAVLASAIWRVLLGSGGVKVGGDAKALCFLPPLALLFSALRIYFGTHGRFFRLNGTVHNPNARVLPMIVWPKEGPPTATSPRLLQTRVAQILVGLVE